MTTSTASDQLSITSGSIRVGRHLLWSSAMLFFGLGLAALGASALTHFGYRLDLAIAGILLILFGPWIALIMALRIGSGYSTDVSPEGLTIPGPTFNPKLIRWDDIEAIVEVRVRFSDYTGIRLRSYEYLLSQYTPRETRILLCRSRLQGVALRAVAPMSIVQKDMGKLIASSKRFGSLASYFVGQRQAYGCDILIPAIDRDRSAQKFAEFLNGFRQRYTNKPSEVVASHA